MAPKSQADLHAGVLAAILEKTGRPMSTAAVKFQGKELILPQGTTYRENINFLQRVEADESEHTSFKRVLTYKRWDVANATAEALRQAFGALRHTGTWLSPPQLVSIQVGPGETKQVPYGVFSVPALPDVSFTVGHDVHEKYGLVGVVSAMGPKIHSGHVEGIFDMIEDYLRTNSIYRGKAFIDGDQPEFIDTAGINPAVIFYAEDVEAQIAGNIFARLDYPDEMEAEGISFKSAHLFEGKYGVGKTEALNLVAKRAVEQGITFIQSTTQDLMQAIQTARMYASDRGAIVAFEDLDTIASRDGENEKIKQVLEAFDGQTAKVNKVMVLLTSNHVNTLHPGMIRPGRIDSVISIGAPDATGIRKLIQKRARPGLLADNIRWDEVAEAMVGYYPSFVVEATGKAIRYGIVRKGGALSEGELLTEDLVNAANELRPQFVLHEGLTVEHETPTLDQAVSDLVRGALAEMLGAIDPSSGQLQQLVSAIQQEGSATRNTVESNAIAVARHTSDDGDKTRSLVKGR